MTIQRRTLLAALAAAPALPMLSACGGGLDEGTVSVRLLNASSGYDTLDLYLDDDRQIGDVVQGQCSNYRNVTSGSSRASVRSGDSGLEIATLDTSFSSETQYTLIAYGSVDQLQLKLITEDAGEPDDGEANLRIFNAATDAGSLDVRASVVGAARLDVFEGGVQVGAMTDFKTQPNRAYHFQVTAVGESDDLRLDIPSILLREHQVATLALVPSLGGALVNAVLLTEDGSAEIFSTDRARVRVANGLAGTDDPRVSASCDATVLATSMKAGSVGSYVLAPASGSLSVTVNGAAQTIPSGAIVAGSDYTLLVYGTSGAAQVNLLIDDNRAPSVTARARVRVVHGSSLHANDTVAVQIDADSVVDALPYGSASDYVTLTPLTTDSEFDVTAGGDTISGSNQGLKATASYTVFVLDSGDTTRWRLTQDNIVGTSSSSGSDGSSSTGG